MIADINAEGSRLIHVDGVPVRAATGEPFDIAELRSLSLRDHELWIKLARSLQGQFAVIAIEAGSAVVITDLTGSYPVFILSNPDSTPRKLSTSLNELEGDSRRSIRRSALFQYVAFGSMDLNQETIYTDVSRAAAGAVSFYSVTKQEISHEYAHWREMAKPAESDPDRAAALLESLIRTYTDRWMSDLPASDPLGILLSGGTDSTLLAALLRNPFATQGRLRCFTQHFRWERYSELAQAKLNAQALGIETEAVMLDRSKHYASVLALNSRLQDQPCIMTQAFNLWSLIQSISSHCRAFMLGEHADSLFLGFGHFFHRLPSEPADYRSATEAIPPKERLAWVAPRFVLDDNDRELLSALELPERDYREWFESFAQNRTARLAPFSDLSLSSLQQLSGQIDGGLNWQRIMLPVLRSTEGIRLLTPFFDSAVVSLALGLTGSLKYQDGKTKFLLRRMLEKQIGTVLMKKPAAASPVAIWRILPSGRERLQITPSLRPYYDRLSRRNTLSLGRLANHHVKVAALGVWMNAHSL
ncbi:MAG TPA: asparagine synthase-related protein [Bryobacteraceae bacterium]|jgi:asparagine synthetase B (glutamine-hydrolysing)|nr:asparagine synthase-related protein [Bryobacteraceae bacterium]